MAARIIVFMKPAGIFALLTLSLSLFSHSAHAFPEMVRYGYVNCNSCHISLTGAGLLNDYGREIAREKLAIWKSDDENSREQLFAYGAMADAPISKYLKLGGDVRSVYYYLNDDNHKEARTIFMQGDFEAAVVLNKFTVDGTLGIEQPVPGKTVDFISRRHYVQYAYNDQFAIRVGKYAPAFGIKNDEHVFLTREQLQFGDIYESYNLELSYITESWNIFVTGVGGRYDSQRTRQDRGATAQVAYSPTEHLKLGVNGWYGEQEVGSTRWVLGAFGMVGLTPRLYASSEVDFQLLSQSPSTPRTKGVATTQKFSYEVIDGLWANLVQEYGKLDFLSELRQQETYGVGFEIFPRSHFEFDVMYEKMRQGGPNQSFADYIWLVSHFYL
jgi:hypothetical protein